MAHILTHDSDCGKIILRLDRIHLAGLNLSGKFLFKRLHSPLRISIPYGEWSSVLTWCLGYKEYTDTVGCKRIENAGINTDHAHHTQSWYCDKTCIIDWWYTFDILIFTLRDIIAYASPRSIRIECILDIDGDIFMEYGIYRRRIYYFSSKVAKLHRLDKWQMRYDVCILYNTRVSSHKSIDIGPYLKHIRIKRCRKYSGGIVTSATSKIGNIAISVRRNESGNHSYLKIKSVKSGVNQLLRQIVVKHMLAKLVHCLYESTWIQEHSILYDTAYYRAWQTFTIAYDYIERPGRQVLYKTDSKIYIAQLAKQRINPGIHLIAVFLRYKTIDYIAVALHHLIIWLNIWRITFCCRTGCGYKFVSYSTKRRNNNNHRFSTALYNRLNTFKAFWCAYRRSAKFQYIHFSVIQFGYFRLQKY